MNKSPFERSLIKIQYSEDNSGPKEKHVTRILQALKGQDPKILAFEAYQLLHKKILDL